MMWAGISLEGKTAQPWGGLGGGLTADRYITEILLDQVLPYVGFVLMYNNARCHTAPDTRQFQARNPVFISVVELKTPLLEKWEGIPQENYKKI